MCSAQLLVQAGFDELVAALKGGRQRVLSAGVLVVIAGCTIGRRYFIGVAFLRRLAGGDGLAIGGTFSLIIPLGVTEGIRWHVFHVCLAPFSIGQVGAGGVLRVLGVVGFQETLECLDVCLALGVAVFGLDAAVGKGDEGGQDADNDAYNKQFDEGEPCLAMCRSVHMRAFH